MLPVPDPAHALVRAFCNLGIRFMDIVIKNPAFIDHEGKRILGRNFSYVSKFQVQRIPNYLVEEHVAETLQDPHAVFYMKDEKRKHYYIRWYSGFSLGITVNMGLRRKNITLAVERDSETLFKEAFEKADTGETDEDSNLVILHFDKEAYKQQEKEMEEGDDE